MREMVLSNWPMLLPIVILSVVAVAIVIERMHYFWSIRSRDREGLKKALSRLTKVPGREILASLPGNDKSPELSLLRFALTSRLRMIPSVFREKLAFLKEREVDRMERGLPLLPGIANVATLMGLFGTVSGMITTFSLMAETGSTDLNILAGGISRALVTTAAGLATATPALLAHHIFEAATNRHDEAMDEVLTEVLVLTGAQYAQKRETKTS